MTEESVRSVLGETNIIAQDTGHSPGIYTCPTPTLSAKMSAASQRNGIPTQVNLVQGKKANKAFRTALALHRENATLQEKSLSDDKENEQQTNSQRVIAKEEGYDDPGQPKW